MERIFVTGGSGFIGSHLIRKLVEMGYGVTNYDLNAVKCEYTVNHIVGDIMDDEKLTSAMKGHSIVCHLAAVVGVVKCLNSATEVYKIDYDGVNKIIEACKEAGVTNLLFASSSEVYGEGSVEFALHESSDLLPKSPYGMAKMMAEELLKQFAMTNNIKVTIVRYCNIYGFGQRDEFVIPIFINKALRQEPLPVCDRGQQVRNFTYIDDAVQGTIQALFRKDTAYDLYNISSSETVEIVEIARKVLELNGHVGELDFIPYEKADRKEELEVIVRVPSVRKASEKLGFKAKVDINQVLQLTYDAYRVELYSRSN